MTTGEIIAVCVALLSLILGALTTMIGAGLLLQAQRLVYPDKAERVYGDIAAINRRRQVFIEWCKQAGIEYLNQKILLLVSKQVAIRYRQRITLTPISTSSVKESFLNSVQKSLAPISQAYGLVVRQVSVRSVNGVLEDEIEVDFISNARLSARGSLETKKRSELGLPHDLFRLKARLFKFLIPKQSLVYATILTSDDKLVLSGEPQTFLLDSDLYLEPSSVQRLWKIQDEVTVASEIKTLIYECLEKEFRSQVADFPLGKTSAVPLNIVQTGRVWGIVQSLLTRKTLTVITYRVPIRSSDLQSQIEAVSDRRVRFVSLKKVASVANDDINLSLAMQLIANGFSEESEFVGVTDGAQTGEADPAKADADIGAEG